MLDKEWVHLSRADPRYEIGAWNFVQSVVSSGDTDMVVCPCTHCRNIDRHLGCDVVDHLIRRGMDESYKQQIDWYHHGDVVSQFEVESKGREWNEEDLQDEAQNARTDCEGIYVD